MVFDSFPEPSMADGLISLFDQHGITYDLEDTSPSLDPSFSGSTIQYSIKVYVLTSQLEEARKLVETKSIQQVTLDDRSHYLFDFSEEELIEVLKKRDEWSNHDFILARKILEERGQVFTDVELEEMRAFRLEHLRRPDAIGLSWTVLGIGLAMMGGLLGIMLGWYYWNIKKSDPDGNTGFMHMINPVGLLELPSSLLVLSVLLISLTWFFV